MSSLSATEFTTDGMWWVDGAWGSRMEDIIRLGVSPGTSYESDADSFITDVFPRGRFNRFMRKGFTSHITPDGEFLARLYEKYGATDEIDGPGYLHDIIETPAGLTPFETWKWNFDRRAGNREPGRPRLDEPEYSGHIFGSRALLLSQVVEFTAEEAEQVALEVARDHIGTWSPADKERLAILDALATKHSYVARDWSSFLSNPVLPTLPAPAEGKPSLWESITDQLVRLAENEDENEEGVFKKRLGWIAQNPNASEELILRAISVLDGGRFAANTYIALAQHPALAKSDDEIEHLMRDTVEYRDLMYLDDEAFATEAREAIAGRTTGPINRVVQELLYDPRREQFAKGLVKDLLRDKNWNMLTLFLPLLPAVLDDAERELTGEVGQLPLEWLMEVI